MTTQEFELLAKTVVIKVMKEQHNIDINYDDLQFVWFAHELGYKKCTLYAKDLGHYYPEVTYNLGKNELYVDIYLKQSNTKFKLDDNGSVIVQEATSNFSGNNFYSQSR